MLQCELNVLILFMTSLHIETQQLHIEKLCLHLLVEALTDIPRYISAVAGSDIKKQYSVNTGLFAKHLYKLKFSFSKPNYTYAVSVL